MKLRNIFLVGSAVCGYMTFNSELWLGWLLATFGLFTLWGFTKMYNDDAVMKAEAEAKGEYYLGAKEVTGIYALLWLIFGGFGFLFSIAVVLGFMFFK